MTLLDKNGLNGDDICSHGYDGAANICRHMQWFGVIKRKAPCPLSQSGVGGEYQINFQFSWESIHFRSQISKMPCCVCEIATAHVPWTKNLWIENVAWEMVCVQRRCSDITEEGPFCHGEALCNIDFEFFILETPYIMTHSFLCMGGAPCCAVGALLFTPALQTAWVFHKMHSST